MHSEVLFVDIFDRDYVYLSIVNPGLDYRPGQYFSLSIPGTGINREYSVCSAGNSSSIDFLIKCVEKGALSPSFFNLAKGDRIEILGPFGIFLAELKSSQKYLFVANGTGIAPFLSVVRSHCIDDYLVLHGVKNSNKIWSSDIEEGRYISCLSDSQSGKRGVRVTDFMNHGSLNFCEFNKVFVCGGRQMVIDCLDLLEIKGISGDSVSAEIYY